MNHSTTRPIRRQYIDPETGKPCQHCARQSPFLCAEHAWQVADFPDPSDPHGNQKVGMEKWHGGQRP